MARIEVDELEKVPCRFETLEPGDFEAMYGSADRGLIFSVMGEMLEAIKRANTIKNAYKEAINRERTKTLSITNIVEPPAATRKLRTQEGSQRRIDINPCAQKTSDLRNTIRQQEEAAEAKQTAAKKRREQKIQDRVERLALDNARLAVTRVLCRLGYISETAKGRQISVEAYRNFRRKQQPGSTLPLPKFNKSREYDTVKELIGRRLNEGSEFIDAKGAVISAEDLCVDWPSPILEESASEEEGEEEDDDEDES
jgi:hypothetical protein